MDELGLNELLQLIIKEKGGTPQQYNKMMDYIAFHETGHKQRMDPKAKQISGNEEDGFYDGPGRGLFQFEVGEKKGGNTAVNRTVRYFKDNNLAIPKWLNDASIGSAGSKSVDVSDLSADQQKMLFLGYHKGHPVSDFSKVWSNEQTIQDFWAENHWAGDKENLTAKLALFNKNITAKDSIDALNIRKAELFGQDDKVPFQSAQNDPNRLPTESDIFKSIFGTQTSSIIDKYNHGGIHLPGDEDEKGTPTINTINAVELLNYYKDKVKKTIGLTNNKKKETSSSNWDRVVFHQESTPTADQIRRLREDYERKHGTKSTIDKMKMIWNASIIEDENGNITSFGDWVPEPEEVEIKATTPKKVDSKKRKLEELIRLPSRSISLIPKEEVRLEKSGIDIDQSKYTYSKYYDPKRGEYRVRVIDKSTRGKSDSEVDNLSLDMFKEFYRYKR